MKQPMLDVRALWTSFVAVALSTIAFGVLGQPTGEYSSTLAKCQQFQAAASYGTGLAGAFGKATGSVERIDYWKLHPFQRGREIEKALGADSTMSANFPAIDAYKNGVATSIKSMDLTSKTYQNESHLKTRLLKYLDELKNWKGGVAAGKQVPPAGEKITKRVLKLGVRSCKVTSMHERVFNEVIKHAEKLKMVVEIVAL